MSAVVQWCTVRADVIGTAPHLFVLSYNIINCTRVSEESAASHRVVSFPELDIIPGPLPFRLRSHLA